MPNTIIFSESIEGLSIRKGDFYLGTNDVGKGPTSLTGFYNGYPVGNYSYIIYLRRITNIFPRSGTTLAFTSAYDGSSYGFGSGTNIQQEFQDNLRPESTTRVTKVSRINSNVSQRDYVYIGLDSPQNSTRIVSFWYYGTYGTQIQVYNNDGSANLSYLNASKNWVAGSTAGFRYVTIPVTVNVWQKIVVRIVNNGSTGVGWSYLILHNDVITSTLANTEYWAFSEFIYEQKPLMGPAIYACQNDAELILRTNQIDRSTVRTTKEQCFTYFAGQSDKMVINTEYPTYTTDQLVFHFDAGFLPSYPATGSTCYDISQGAENISLINGPLFNSFGYFMLDGINDRLGSSGVNLVDAITGTFSFSFGAIFMIPSYPPQRASDTANYSSLLMKGSYNPSFGISLIYDTPVGGVHTRVRAQPGIRNLTTSGSPGYGLESLTTSASFSLGRWYRIDFTCSNSGTTHFLKNYINGVLDSSYTATNNLYPIAIQNTSDITVASSPLQGNGFTSNPTLNISQGSVYTKELSSLEILQNYYQGPIATDGLVFFMDPANLVSYTNTSNIAYSLIGGYTASLESGATFSKIHSGVFDLDGTDDFIQMPHNNYWNSNVFGTATNFTIECWYKPDLFMNWDTMIWKQNPSVGGFYSSPEGAAIWSDVNGFVAVFASGVASNPGGSGVQIFYATTTLKWYHLCFTGDGTTLRFYVDGVQRGTALVASRTVAVTTSSNGPSFGRRDFMNGQLGNVKFYTRHLSASEVVQNFNAHRSRFGI